MQFFGNKGFPPHLKEQYEAALQVLEESTGNKFGGVDGKRLPLLISVRSGAAVSMPGMMDTCLNLGMNDEVMKGLAIATNNLRFALDTQRRFLQMYGTVVLGIEDAIYEDVLKAARYKQNIEHDCDLSTDSLNQIIKSFKEVTSVSDNPCEQLKCAIEAVFKSWFTPRAVKYSY